MTAITYKRAVSAIACMALAACAKELPARATDTFCIGAKKIQWSIEDTAETIRKAEIWNKTIDRRCGIPGRSAGLEE